MSIGGGNMFSHLIPQEIRGVNIGDAAIPDMTQNGSFAPNSYPQSGVQSAPVVSQTPVASAPAPTGTPAPSATPAPAGTPSALDAWQTFYNSPTFQVPLQEGLKAVNTKYAAMGALESGAAMKGVNNYAQGAASSALGTYMDDLYRQEALGESASAATAGVGEGLVNQVSANNNNAASAAGNAALVGGQASANNWNSIGGAIGSTAGTIAGALSSSYHPIPAYDGSAPMSVSLPTAQPYQSLPGGFY